LELKIATNHRGGKKLLDSYDEHWPGKKDLKEYIKRNGQKHRAFGIYLMLMTRTYRGALEKRWVFAANSWEWVAASVE
jgi:hypothetical protein